VLNFLERQVYREKMGEILAEKVMYIAEAMSRHEYVPKLPNQVDLELAFDTGYTDVQPYCFKVSLILLIVVFFCK